MTVHQKRRLAALGAVALLAMLVAVVAGSGDEQSPVATKAVARPEAPSELPRGGRSIFPEFRVVAYYGAPQAAELGALGIGTPSAMAKRLARQASPYRAGGRPELPAMELIATIANAHPGDDGQYRTRQPDAVIARYLKAARAMKALLILDIQPGYGDFLREARHLEKWLREPDVSLALDPSGRSRPARCRARSSAPSTPARSTRCRSGWPTSSAAGGCPRSCSSSTASPRT